ncbi:PVC-type heme-binding CxxCH protein [Planctomicrobium sp. SH527]|uniref:PVC-type heme-binding CxxCH protein n=1 Tax=Planctomicrobium sp. SH527 TaxID=3448123 RepID=UPI003F5BF600
MHRLRLPAFIFLFLASCSCILEANDSKKVKQPAKDTSGWLPKDESGRALNLNFEAGTLQDWTATGTAFEGQPIQGPIDQKRLFGAGKKSQHTGEFWIGGYEKHADQPQGTLTSAPFLVDGDWCSFLLGGGNLKGTRVELVLEADQSVIATATGMNQEEMTPRVIHLGKYRGKKMFVRIVDHESGGWGHVNFDDFRLYRERPVFDNEPKSIEQVQTQELYPYQNLTGPVAASRMRVPPGFKVQCSADEPDVQQPITMAIDDRGRVWIAEAYAYPKRAPEGQGRDRILILEDTDLDGKLDKRTVFLEGLNLVSGLEIGFGGVWIGAAPYLLFVPDQNANDMPDLLEQAEVVEANSKGSIALPGDVPRGAQVVLDGWGDQDTHEVLNSFAWGPDGWLYGCHGIFTHSNVGTPGTPAEKRVPLNAGVWRFHPVRKTFEVFAHGTSNPWGIDWNQYGDAFITACVIPHLYHVIQGGRYQRQAGAHFQNATFDDLKTIARHRHYVGNQWNQNDRNSSDDVGGGHAHAGALLYQGGAWPEEYHGKLFMHNIHGNRINVDVLIPEGSGYAGDRNPDFLHTGDQWSQMLSFATGPDGQVWVIDWYDQEQCHRHEVDRHDRSNGRIYRISYGDATPVRINLQTHTDEQLLQLAIYSRNEWEVRHARRLLQERTFAGTTDIKSLPLLNQIRVDDESAMLRRIWLLQSCGQFSTLSDPEIANLLLNTSPYVRSWTIRGLVEVPPDADLSASREQQFVELARNDPSPVVRLAIAAAAQRIPVQSRWQIIQQLLTHQEDANDHNLPLMIWYAMEPLAEVDPQRALALGMQAGDTFPRLREFMIRRIGGGRPEEALVLLVKGLKDSKTDDARLTFLMGIRGALAGTRLDKAPEGWTEIYESLAKSGVGSRNFDVYLYTLGLGARFGRADASELLRQIVTDEAGALAERRVGFSFLVDDQDTHLTEVVEQLLAGGTLRADAIRSLSRIDSARLAQSVIENYKSLSTNEQATARGALASRESYARDFLKAVESNRIPKADLSADQVHQLRQFNSKELNEVLDRVWGRVRESSADSRAEISRLTDLVQNDHQTTPDIELGRTLFAKTCQQCHTLFGVGGNVGPDITGANRGNLEYLLSNIVDPSAVMAQEYRPLIVAMEDGRVVTGVLKSETATTLVLQTANDLVTVLKQEIEVQRQSDHSMMPNGLLAPLSPFEIRSLVAYLSSPRQVPRRAVPANVSQFFSGNDLTGWHTTVTADQEYWSIADRTLTAKLNQQDHDVVLFSDLALRDFRLKFDFQISGLKNGFGVRHCNSMASEEGLQGPELLLHPTSPAIYSANRTADPRDQQSLTHVVKSEKVLPVADAWNQVELTSIGNRTQYRLNGTTIADDSSSLGMPDGVFAFRIPSGSEGELKIRGLKVELLSSLPEHAKPEAAANRWPSSTPVVAGQKIRWKKSVLDHLFRSEGCAVADFDNDGDMDIAAGAIWYEQTDAEADKRWKPHGIQAEQPEYPRKGYSHSFMNFAADVDRDGRVDQIVIGFPGAETNWYRNPGLPSKSSKVGVEDVAQDAPWAKHLMVKVVNNESPLFVDLLGTGQRTLLSGIENKVIAYSRSSPDSSSPWQSVPVSNAETPGADRFSHGLGVGDLNGDGLLDVLTIHGWWEQPMKSSTNSWKFHPAAFGQPCAQMIVYDFSGDGRNDVLTSSAHGFGIWWHEQIAAVNGEIQWKTHLIDDSISQTHALVLADVNGDGLPDFVTGRRHWAHNGNDPGEDQPAVLCWFELTRESGVPRWKKHLIDDNSGIGTQFEVADVNGDGQLDIVTSNKLGTFLLEQVRSN